MKHESLNAYLAQLTQLKYFSSHTQISLMNIQFSTNGRNFSKDKRIKRNLVKMKTINLIEQNPSSNGIILSI